MHRRATPSQERALGRQLTLLPPLLVTEGWRLEGTGAVRLLIQVTVADCLFVPGKGVGVIAGCIPTSPKAAGGFTTTRQGVGVCTEHQPGEPAVHMEIVFTHLSLAFTS